MKVSQAVNEFKTFRKFFQSLSVLEDTLSELGNLQDATKNAEKDYAKAVEDKISAVNQLNLAKADLVVAKRAVVEAKDDAVKILANAEADANVIAEKNHIVISNFIDDAEAKVRSERQAFNTELAGKTKHISDLAVEEKRLIASVNDLEQKMKEIRSKFEA